MSIDLYARRVACTSLSHGKRIVFFLLLPLCLLGCVGNKQNLIYETFRRGIENPNNTIDQIELDPRYRYLKVDVNNIPALLVLGYEENTSKGVITTWYSAFKEVVEIQNGRLINTQGLELNWTDVSLTNAPDLANAVMTNTVITNNKNSALRYQRIRTVMPSYRANIEETVEIQPLENAPDDAPRFLKSSTAIEPLRWVQETVVMQTNIRTPYLDPLRAIYAINPKTAQVIYGRQCLAAQFCVSWLQWPYPNVQSSRTQPVQAK